MNYSSIHDQVNKIYPVSRETFERLELFVSRLEEWQKKTNLVAPSTLDDIWNRHICDSLQCIAIKPDARKWLDIGSGGGFPGLVIAAVMGDKENSSVTLVESNQKKCSFLRQANRQMGTKASIFAERIESIPKHNLKQEVVTARALASLPNLFELTHPWLSQGSIGLFHKGRDFEGEIYKCDGLWSYDLVNHRSKVSSDSVLLEISNLVKKNGCNNA